MLYSLWVNGSTELDFVNNNIPMAKAIELSLIVGANLFAHKHLIVRMNSHLQK